MRGRTLVAHRDALAPLAVAGGFAYIEPDEPATHGWMVSVWADSPGSATRVRLMAVESSRRVLRAANPGRPDIAVTRASETMVRAVVVFVGRAVRGATPRHCRPAPLRNVALAVRRPGGPRGNPVVTGRKTGLQASRGMRPVQNATILL